MGKKVRIHDKFQHHMDDTFCKYCLFYRGKRKHRKYGCQRPVCCCESEKLDAMENGRIERKKGWNRWRAYPLETKTITAQSPISKAGALTGI
ncbi:MAG: hypothetical protein LBS62_09790 [Clostridiales bacterium]|nr:hypothetical protein [Clostridiales bacterium]